MKTISEFIENIIETNDDGHDFMPADIKEGMSQSDICEWVESAIDNLELDVEYNDTWLSCSAEIVLKAVEYITEGDE